MHRPRLPSPAVIPRLAVLPLVQRTPRWRRPVVAAAVAVQAPVRAIRVGKVQVVAEAAAGAALAQVTRTARDLAPRTEWAAGAPAEVPALALAILMVPAPATNLVEAGTKRIKFAGTNARPRVLS